MNDLISRQAAIDAIKKNTFRLTFAEEQNCEGHVAWSAEAVYSDVMEGALLELPSARPEIIYCGECKHMMPNGKCRQFADSTIRPSASDFCSAGERKDSV